MVSASQARYWISGGIFCLLAVVFAAGLFLTLMGFSPPLSSDPVLSAGSVAMAAFLCSALFWWLFVIRPGRINWKRGAIAGGLTGLLAHPLAFILSAYTSFLRFGPAEGGWLESVLLAPALSAALSAFSLLLFGWLTVAAGAIVGGFIGRFFQDR